MVRFKRRLKTFNRRLFFEVPTHLAQHTTMRSTKNDLLMTEKNLQLVSGCECELAKFSSTCCRCHHEECSYRFYRAMFCRAQLCPVTRNKSRRLYGTSGALHFTSLAANKGPTLDYSIFVRPSVCQLICPCMKLVYNCT